MTYILGRLISWNIKFEKVDSKCVRVYGNFDGFSVVRESEQENYIEVDGRLIDYEDFEDWLYVIKQWNDDFLYTVDIHPVEKQQGLTFEACANKKGADMYILPSSIHEVILLPSDRINDPTELLSMVHDANTTVVSIGDVLSDSVYYYDRKTDHITEIVSDEKM